MEQTFSSDIDRQTSLDIQTFGTTYLFAVSGSDALSENEYKHLYSVISPQRRERTRKFLRREDACRSLIGEALIRYAIRSVTGNVLEDDPFEINGYGKPYIKGSCYYVNITHSGTWVVCGVDNQEIGVDIERKHSIDLGVTDSYFAPAEKELINKSRSNHAGFEMFFKIWTLKESYIKAIGKGLSCPLESFACLPSMHDDHVEFHRYEETLPPRKFRLINLDPNYSCAVCCTHLNINAKPFIITPKQLVEFLQKRF